MDYINVTNENLENEHICCAISNNRDVQVASKKCWLAERFDDGLVFLKGDARGKCFIEYIPAEKAWAPISAQGYMHIDCFWVSGQYKGHGYSNDLLEKCIRDSKNKGKKGVCVISSEKKKLSFLSDPSYLKYKGFVACDTAEPYFVLYYLPFDKAAEKPSFRSNAKTPHTSEKGFVLYYTAQCPFTAKYVPVIEAAAKKDGIPFKSVQFKTAGEAQNAPSAFTAYTLFYNGEFITHEILSEKKFAGIAEKVLKQ